MSSGVGNDRAVNCVTTTVPFKAHFITETKKSLFKDIKQPQLAN